METDLRLALSRGEFSVQYQPQVDARDNRITGAEALVRWHHPQLGAQSPTEFIKVLEDSGLILEVGTWILDEACKAFKQLTAKGLIDPLDFSLCVNISPPGNSVRPISSNASNTVSAATACPAHC